MPFHSANARDSAPGPIENAISSGFVLLAVIGPHWLDAKKPDGTRRLSDPRDPVRTEIEAALRKGA